MSSVGIIRRSLILIWRDLATEVNSSNGQSCPAGVYAVQSTMGSASRANSGETLGIEGLWTAVLDEAVNKRDLSTGETGEFASENVGFGLNPGG